ncbi:MAG: DNA repair protein RecN [Gammaproteobacteria bacterium]|jgi:DNA repair protein RecN (Recombination protein N)|nr:DNA repair protein RecN [Gammaproteobacteria bacterium]
MLSHILIQDLAVVSALELELGPGMTALTGETGAGKSILIDALGLALGDRADAGMIRAGRERAEVAASFDLSAVPAARDWLAEQDLAEDGDCAIRRLLPASGRSRAYINGRLASGTQLQSLGEHLVDIHGQHAHQSLLRPAAQRDLLDGYAGQTSQVRELAGRFRDYRAREERLRALLTQGAERAARLDLLRFQVEELEGLGLTAQDIEELDREQRRLAHLGLLQGTAGRLLDALYDGEGALRDQLGRAETELDGLLSFDERLGEVRDLIAGAAIQVEEAASGLRQYLDGLELDPALLEQVEARLAQVHDLARKYRVLPHELPETLDRLRGELAGLEGNEVSLDMLTQERDGAWQRYREQALALSAARQAAGARLSATVTAAMAELSMKGGRFEVQLTRLAEDAASSQGLDRVEFLVSANPGQPLQPLAKVASGGELSRISLCIQVATAECAAIPTLVFDEVDVGIGGAVAEVVGRLLRALGERRQVLCVTHLPQVAAQAHHHLQVRKETRDGQTHTHITRLGAAARIDEIARMLGGTTITEKTLAHAREMIERAGG